MCRLPREKLLAKGVVSTGAGARIVVGVLLAFGSGGRFAFGRLERLVVGSIGAGEPVAGIVILGRGLLGRSTFAHHFRRSPFAALGLQFQRWLGLVFLRQRL